MGDGPYINMQARPAKLGSQRFFHLYMVIRAKTSKPHLILPSLIHGVLLRPERPSSSRWEGFREADEGELSSLEGPDHAGHTWS
jgi:hypothetical protein